VKSCINCIKDIVVTFKSHSYVHYYFPQNAECAIKFERSNLKRSSKFIKSRSHTKRIKITWKKKPWALAYSPVPSLKQFMRQRERERTNHRLKHFQMAAMKSFMWSHQGCPSYCCWTFCCQKLWPYASNMVSKRNFALTWHLQVKIHYAQSNPSWPTSKFETGLSPNSWSGGWSPSTSCESTYGCKRSEDLSDGIP